MIQMYKVTLPNGRWTSVMANSDKQAKEYAASIFHKSEKGLFKKDFKNIQVTLLEKHS